MLTSLHIEGSSLLHRLPVRVKLMALVASSIGLFLSASLAVQAIAFIVAAALYLSAGLTPKEALKRVGFVFLTIFFLAAVNLFYLSVAEVATLTLRLMALVLFAAAVTATTTISAFMDEITILLSPLERLGWLKGADVSLALGLVLRFVPDIFARYQAIREAHHARGLPVRPLTIIGPLIILTLKDADTIAAAIDARGFRRQ
ncbi:MULTISPECIES: energy-coupling factor transporter transmembrane protein EcfT [Ensifer]|uniref:Energy-coupling factor transporter transmembrane protein EcfT n=1 Tax=Ensifer adhaerens TaxID=106592 RepID=A0ABY8HGP0_ENSAD|nr:MULTISPECIES: energy-coupling factor transporter transmembrane protein EcfT [Ensifer]KDP72103.1 transporter [Ensifer adhaerens]MBD9538336.1 energy-coupling factor transporter transmembrane protein EcfT [Ensifer sp. ENS04]QHG70969.1 energy-coupling factor transporter transmembrane protein EcfT [Ensifer adhaerens]WFP91291.1 energy-coupling factor transporter transmembrane protein EcfT [Ensifer adhaerens]SFF73726.1 biotin transport system permease protein [Ensifer sp. OV372]